MATLSVTLTSAQINRIQQTFDPVATTAEVEDWMKRTLKGRVVQKETGAAHANEYARVASEAW